MSVLRFGRQRFRREVCQDFRRLTPRSSGARAWVGARFSVRSGGDNAVGRAADGGGGPGAGAELGFYRGRVETDRWTAFRSHWGIEPFYCRPGIEGAHEKGGVEGQIGYFRRNHFVPVSEVASLTELNAMVDQWDQDDEARGLRGRTRTIGDYFADEQHLLRPLPTEPFETGRWFTPRVNRFSQISVRGNVYSVPVRFIGRQLRVLLHANDLVVYDGRQVVTRHGRLGGRNGSRLVLDHYLEALLRKPGAFTTSGGQRRRPPTAMRLAPVR